LQTSEFAQGRHPKLFQYLLPGPDDILIKSDQIDLDHIPYGVIPLRSLIESKPDPIPHVSDHPENLPVYIGNDASADNGLEDDQIHLDIWNARCDRAVMCHLNSSRSMLLAEPKDIMV